MTQNYTGMRKGISIVEMVIAIVLFATLSVISLKYVKNFLNTDMAAKKARVAAVIEQGQQLQQAYAIYKVETGIEPTAIGDLNASGVLTLVPTRISELSSRGWELNTTINSPGVVFTMTLDKNTSATDKSGSQYCAIFNRDFNSSTTLDVQSVTDHYTAGDWNASIVTATAQGHGDYFCYTSGATTTGVNTNKIVIIPR